VTVTVPVNPGPSPSPPPPPTPASAPEPDYTTGDLRIESGSGTGSSSDTSTVSSNACADGSEYQTNAAYSDLIGKCATSDDCQVEGECCVVSFCLCGNPKGRQDICVPPHNLSLP